MRFNIFKKQTKDFNSTEPINFPKLINIEDIYPSSEQMDLYEKLCDIRKKYNLYVINRAMSLTGKYWMTQKMKEYCEEMISIEYKPIEPFSYFVGGKKISSRCVITELDNGLLKVKQTTKDKIIETTYNNWSKESKGIKRFISKADIKRVKDILKQSENWS